MANRDMKVQGIAQGGTHASWLAKLWELLRTLQVSRKPRQLRLQEALALGDKRQLLVVEWESRRYLVGATQQGLTLLDTRSGEELGSER